MRATEILRDRVRGMLLAGACGDALGAPVEFLSLEDIRAKYGELGPEAYVGPAAYRGQITDDTQMTLFTAEGVIRAAIRGRDRGLCHPASVVHHAYLRWLWTQGVRVERFEREENGPSGWLAGQGFLHEARAPGNTCLGALRASRDEFRDRADNDSKGCGSVMRIAPAALWDLSSHGLDAFDEGCAYARLTHAHPTGELAAGFQSKLLAHLLTGMPLRDGIELALERLRAAPDYGETARAVEAAVARADDGPPSAEQVERLGAGWIAEEALAIALYAALVAPDLRGGLRLAVTHGGDSDSTGAIAGNLLGAMFGEAAIPADLRTDLEGREVIEQVADDLVRVVVEGKITDDDVRRYPGW